MKGYTEMNLRARLVKWLSMELQGRGLLITKSLVFPFRWTFAVSGFTTNARRTTGGRTAVERVTLGAAVVVALVFGACQVARDVRQSIIELQAVQRAVVRATGHTNVTVNLTNNRHLTIGLVNSPLRGLPAGQRRAKALEIAKVAYLASRSRGSLTGVTVAFVVHRSYLVIFNYNDATDAFAFDRGELTGRESANALSQGS